jgi:hypothetical protein
MTTITNQIAIIGKEGDDDGEIALLYKLSRDRQIDKRQRDRFNLAHTDKRGGAAQARA